MNQRVLKGLQWVGEVGMLCMMAGSLGAIAPPHPAQAQTAVQSVGAQTVQGTYETGVYELVIGTSQGVNVSWIRTGEVIEMIWLNDPSRVVISSDGCLPNQMIEGGNCSGTGAQIIQIRQLQEAIEFPAIATTAGSDVFLTVVTTGSSGRKIYQFSLQLQNGNPPVSLVEIIPAPPPSPAQLTSISQPYQQEVFGQLSRGLAVAEAEGLIDTQSQAYSQIRDCITRMQNGTAFADAVQQSNVPRDLVSRLRSLGSESSVVP